MTRLTRLGGAGPDVAATGTRRIAWLGMIGGLLVLGASLLPWVSMTVGPPTAFDLPLAFLIDLDAPAGEPLLGWALVGVGAVAVCVSPWRWGRWVRPVLGALGLLVGGAFVVQFARDIDHLRSIRFVVDHLGAGVYVALIGSGLLLGDRR